VDGQIYRQTVNQLGVYPLLIIKPKGQVEIHISYPGDRTGDPIAVQVQDGGHLVVDNGQSAMSEVATIDQQNSIDFQFKATEQLGVYRVALRDGASVSVVNLWAAE
jgi:hypothetical protein